MAVRVRPSGESPDLPPTLQWTRLSLVMRITNIHEAKTNFSKLVERVAAGEEIIIGKAGKPVARLVPYKGSPRPKRKPGAWKGKIWISPDFDTLPPDLQAAFDGGLP
jgi:prevent-host-death family protein